MQSEAISALQRVLRLPIRCNQMQSDAIRGNQRTSEGPSTANQMQSDAIRCNQRQSAHFRASSDCQSASASCASVAASSASSALSGPGAASAPSRSIQISPSISKLEPPDVSTRTESRSNGWTFALVLTATRSALTTRPLRVSPSDACQRRSTGSTYHVPLAWLPGAGAMRTCGKRRGTAPW